MDGGEYIVHDKLIRIGEVSKLLGISVQSIRHYEKNMLINPSFISEDNRYRYYSKDDVDKLWRIVVLKSAGFSLKEIKNISSLSLDETYVVLSEQRRKLKDKIEMEKIALKYVERNMNVIEYLQVNKEKKAIYKYIEDRYGKGIETTDLRSYKEHYKKISQLKAIYGMHQEVVYQPSRQVDISNVDDIKLKRLFAINADEYRYDDGDVCQKAGLYYCKVIKFDKKGIYYYNQMIKQILKDGYRLRGDSLEIILIDNSIARGIYVCEIQIAVLE